MKCPSCGTDNDMMRNRCMKCNLPLARPMDNPSGQKARIASSVPTISPTEVARTYKNEYSRATNDQADRSIEYIQELCALIMEQKVGHKELCESVLRLIFRQYHIREGSIALRSASDGRYRYFVMQGMRSNVWEVHLGLSYAREHLFDSKKYKCTSISRYTKLFLAEDEPYDDAEKKTYSEHLMLSSTRMVYDDSIEGDYLDIIIFGPGEQILGWIEISGTWDGKLPGPRVIMTIEVLANLLGIALSRIPSIAGPEPQGSNHPPTRK